MWNEIEAAIGEATGEPFRIERRNGVGGGCINEAHCLEGGARRYFVKLNSAGRLAMFEAEAAGLEAILASRSIYAPAPLATGVGGGRSWLVLEQIDFGTASRSTSAALGEQLAQMHRCTAEAYGWHRDNTIGATPQPNPWTAEWREFLRRHRLAFQLELAAGNGAPDRLVDRGRRLLENLGAFFADYRPAPSLLHGDLWGGNWGTDAQGRPVIFDPAVYFGDREADLAMTELFGGFDRTFYDAYDGAWPRDPGYRVRRSLYNLYHVLNHFNLFGGGYADQALRLVDGLLAELER
jgi:fructosamine-3-kinase